MDYSSLVISIIVAIIPSIILCYYVYENDIVEKEPMKMLFMLFFLGVLTTVPASFMERAIISATKISENGMLNCFILSFLIVALIEEGYKYLIVYLGTWKNKNFDHKYDAIVYAVFVSLGFATLENILYIIRNGTEIALLRGVLSVPAHAFYAVASGYYLGLAKKCALCNLKSKSMMYKILALLAPVLLHGIFDFLLLTNNEVLFGIFYCFVACLYIISYTYIKKVSKTKMMIDKK